MKSIIIALMASYFSAAAELPEGYEIVHVPVYADGTSINPDGTLDIADTTERAAYKKLPSLKRSCAKGSAAACFETATILQNESFTWIKDLPASIPYLQKACSKNHIDSCLLLTVSYFNGTGTSQNYHEALRISRKLCSRKIAEGCFNTAISYENGYGVRQDTIEAWEYFGKSCDYGYQSGCDNYTRMNKTR
ncbi:tetratricopeptide repeat protein [Sulfuricurvum sp.]|uniref:tetratricopeptide repeat protein n=1 Tax=Sulfuricurvum sp. TaxID=2025608 RepID=UPI002D62F135|nr:tetratricopeptide repeat protein [Sulfuricurvum sp.]HZF69833.1 tetratricopeptide repeat protein [Sulfuricurvum sp.]